MFYQKKIKNFYNPKLVYFIKLNLFIIFIFFFDLGFKNFNFLGFHLDYIDGKYLFIIILPFFLLDFFATKINYKSNIKLLTIPLFIFFHYFILTKYFEIISLKDSFKFIIYFLYIIIFFFYRNFIFFNFKKIIEIFLIYYFFLIILFYLKNLYFSLNACLFGCFSVNREIYKEASHLAYIAPIIIIYYLSTIDLKLLSKSKKFFLFFFLITLIFNLSTTLFASIMLPSLILFFFNYKKIFNKKYFVLINFFFLLLIPFDKNTLIKIDFIYPVSHYFKNIKSNIQNIKSNIQSNLDNRNFNLLKTSVPKKFEPNVAKNLSIEVTLANSKLAIYSLSNYPLGWGMNNYKYAHQKNMPTVNLSNVEGVGWLNSNDGSNNFNKGMVEFGFFFIIFIFFMFNFLINKDINIQIKYLIIPILFTQVFIRGSGFFNGSFIIMSILMICYLKDNKKI